MDGIKAKKRGKLITKTMDQIGEDYSEERQDSIGKLPDALLVDLISLLPVKQAIQTSILSKRWRNLWKFMHNLQFDSFDSWRHLKWQECADCMDTFLSQHQAPKIRRFNLWFATYNGNAKKVDSWIQYALSHGVEEFLLYINYDFFHKGTRDAYKLPSCVFQGQWLTELRLIECEVQMPSSVCLPLLKKLVLENLKVSSSHVIGFIISRCPTLESLSIFRCSGHMERLVISVGSLHFRSLTVGHSGQIVIDAPTLQSLELQNRPVHEDDHLLGNLSSLIKVHLDWSLVVNFYDLMKVLSRLHHVRHIKLSAGCILALSFGTCRTPIMATCLELVTSLTTTTNLRRIRRVLSFFPGVETLILVFKEADYPLTSQRCWNSVKDSLLKPLLKIKNIEIQEYISCRIVPERVTLDEIWQSCEVKTELVRSVLEKSTCLEKIVIILTRKYEFTEWEGKPQFKQKLRENLENFQRASPGAKIYVY